MSHLMHKYTHVGIEPLSHAQARKLVQGGRVKVKLGTHHKIHITPAHAKRLHAAHKRGAGIMLELDPYACELNGHMHGEGIASKLKHAGHKIGKFVKGHKEQFRPLANSLKEAGHQAVADASMYALDQGVDPSLVGAYGAMAHQGIHGGKITSAKQFFRSPAIKTVRKALRPLGQMALNDTLGLAEQGLTEGMMQASQGMGLRKYAPIKKTTRHHGVPMRHIKGAALFPAGMGFMGL